MSVGVVAGNSMLQPDDARSTQVIAQAAFDLPAAELGIAGLYGAEQALLRGQQQTLSVDVDAAAFEHHLRREYGELEALAEEGGDGGVFAPVVVLGPGIEAPRGEADFPGDVLDEQGTIIARPD